MQVTSVCPLRVASFLWQPRVDALALTVVCKATFTLAPARSSLAPIQEEPLQADLLHEDGLFGTSARPAISSPSSAASMSSSRITPTRPTARP